GQSCSIARSLEIVGERWSILILRNAMFAGMTRFSDFERTLRIAPNILARRLEFFLDEGIMTASKGASGHLEYHLTEKGWRFKAALMALREWGDRYKAPLGPPVTVHHEGCGGKVEIRPTCAKCGESPRLDHIHAQPTAVYGAYEEELASKRNKRHRVKR
ncbi:MAG TPA: helix-turn-helix domain-containing protein, partial [bacterium]